MDFVKSLVSLEEVENIQVENIGEVKNKKHT